MIKYLGTNWNIAGYDHFMVLILDGNLVYVARAWRKIDLFAEKNAICDNLSKCQKTEIVSEVRTYFWVTI